MSRLRIAVVVCDAAGTWLVARVNRSPAGDVYHMLHSTIAEQSHASYHKSGQRHFRIADQLLFVCRRTPPGLLTDGIEDVFEQGFRPAAYCQNPQWATDPRVDELFRIERVVGARDQHYSLAVQLALNVEVPQTTHGRELIDRREYPGPGPILVLSLWRFVEPIVM